MVSRFGLEKLATANNHQQQQQQYKHIIKNRQTNISVSDTETTTTTIAMVMHVAFRFASALCITTTIKQIAMAPKKRSAPAVAPSPASKKAKLKSSENEAPSASLHPTAVFVSEHILQPLGPELSKLASTEPKDYAGICAFSKNKYTENMVKHGEYECNLLACDHKLGDLDHLVPIGSIIRLCKNSFYDEEAKEPRAAALTHAVAVRALSAIDPDANSKEPVANMSYLLAFLLAWAQCKKLGLKTELAKFFEFGQMVRTRFVLLPDKDDFERRKWSLPEGTKELSEQTVLYGISRITAVTEVRNDLMARKQDHDHNAVSKWFSTVKVSSSSEKLPRRRQPNTCGSMLGSRRPPVPWMPAAIWIVDWLRITRWLPRAFWKS